VITYLCEDRDVETFLFSKANMMNGLRESIPATMKKGQHSSAFGQTVMSGGRNIILSLPNGEVCDWMM